MTQIQKFLLLLSTLSLISTYSTVSSAQPYKALVAPITKDTPTSLYTLTLNFIEKYVIDLGAPFSWYHCPKEYSPISCSSRDCSKAQSYLSPLCPSFPSFHNNGTNQCTNCTVTPVNPITKTCALAELTYNDLIISWTNGRIQTVDINFNQLLVSCAPMSLLNSLPIGASGMASLSKSPLALSMQFTPPYLGVKKQFSICLPSSDATSPGVALFGEGPFYLMPSTDFDVRSILTYTPLLVHSTKTSLDYYIDLKAIAINGKICRFLSRILEFNSLGYGGVKLSTIVPYTTMKSQIFKSFIRDFAKATRGIPRVEKVEPFELCLNTSSLGSTQMGLLVPEIDLELVDGKNWTIFGANSMKQISNNVVCLAFVDGGDRMEEAVVIGSYQMENNFLLFDLEESRLGFSSSLFLVRTTCSNFSLKTRK